MATIEKAISIIFCLIINLVNGSLINLCSNPPTLNNYNPHKLTGSWFDYAYTGMPSKEDMGRCQKSSFNVTSNLIKETITHINDKNKLESTVYTYVLTESNELRYTDKFAPVLWWLKLFGVKEEPLSYKVIATDQENYWLFHYCNQMNPYFSIDELYLSTKEKKPSELVLNEVYERYTSFGYSMGELKYVDQDLCTLLEKG